jgi:hypothetical protein
MFEAIITILISLNLHFTVVEDNRSIQLTTDELNRLKTNDEFINKTQEGTIHDLVIIHSDIDQIIIVPDVDPVE